VKTSAKAKPVVAAPREAKQPAEERRKTFILRGNKENVANAKQKRPAAVAAVAPPARAPEPAPRRLPSAATIAHPSRFENLAISPFVSGQNRFQNVEMSPVVHGPWNEKTSPVAIPETIRRETYGVPAQGTFMKKLIVCKEEPDCSVREAESFLSTFSPQFCSTTQKKRTDPEVPDTAMESSFDEGNERLSAGTYVLDRLSTETYIKEEPEERLSPVGNERATKGCVRNLSGTVLEAISEEDGNRGAAPVPPAPPPALLVISPPKGFNSDKKPARMSPTVVTRRKITVRPEVQVFTPPDKEDAAKMPCPPTVPRAAMPRLTLSRAATTSRQSSLHSSRPSLGASSSRQSLSASQGRKGLSAASSRQSLSTSSSRQSLNSSACSSSSGSSARMPRLNASARARRQKSEFLYDPDALIAEMINNDLVAASTSADPFLANTLFFDDSWKRKRELDMLKWLNALLTPPVELAASTDSPAVDLATVWQRCCRSEPVELAPTREDVSAEVYDSAGRLSSLRRAAVSFLAQTEIRQVLGKVAVHIDKKLLVVREDRDLHLDTGLKYQVLELLLCYNPLWLRIGLEAIYGRTVSLASNCDVVGLAKFIVENLLTDRNTVAEHSHPTVPHLRQPSFAEAMKKFILKKFFFLVYFLDRAKMSKLIKHDPCLFMKNAKCKESREIVIAFASAFLSGVGDVMKHLALLGYHLDVKQQYIDEFEFAVTCLKDLRDGVRLVRVMEIILNKDGLLAKLRVPAISMLQKVHNMEVALNALSEAGYVITGNITAKDLVNGHYEKTLSLLWQIIYKFQAPRLDEAARKIQAWWRNRRLYATIQNRVAARKRAVYYAAAARIQAAWRGRMARKRVAKLREDRAAEEARRESAAVVIQKTWRMVAARRQLLRAIRASNRIKEWFTGALLTRQLRQTFLTKRQAAIKIQSAVRGYLTRKRLANLRRTAAALHIQTWFRHQKTAKALECAAAYAREWTEERKRVSQACRIIQARFRARKEMERQRSHYMALRAATVTLQRRFRLHLVMKKDRMAFLTLKRSVITCQQIFRANRAMKEERTRFAILKKSTIIIQRRFRAQLAMREAREEFLEMRSAAVCVQQRFRMLSLMKKDRMAFLSLRRSVITCQQIFRANRAIKEKRQRFVILKKATVTIQRWFRAKLAMRQAREAFLKKRSAAVCLQRRFRLHLLMKKDRMAFLTLKRSVIMCQQIFRANRATKEQRQRFVILKKATVTIQRRFRAQLAMREAREEFLRERSAATILQVRWRALTAMRHEKSRYEELTRAVVCVQRWWRAIQTGREVRRDLETKRTAAVVLQRRWRAKVQMNRDRAAYLKLRSAIVVLQTRWRYVLRRRAEQRLKEATISARIHKAATKIQVSFAVKKYVKK